MKFGSTVPSTYPILIIRYQRCLHHLSIRVTKAVQKAKLREMCYIAKQRLFFSPSKSLNYLQILQMETLSMTFLCTETVSKLFALSAD